MPPRPRGNLNRVFPVNPRIAARARERYRVASSKDDVFDAFTRTPPPTVLGRDPLALVIGVLLDQHVSTGAEARAVC